MPNTNGLAADFHISITHKKISPYMKDSRQDFQSNKYLKIKIGLRVPI